MGTTKKGQAGDGYGPRNNTREDNTTPAKYGAVVKLQWLRATASRADIPRATLAACIILADHADATTGICWPSFATIAKAIGTDSRHTKRAISKAVEAGLISITEHGNRVRSNRYRLNLDAIGSGTNDTTLCSGIHDTRVVSSRAEGSGTQAQKVVVSTPPESIHLSEHQARDRWEISGNPDGDALAPRPRGAQLARQPDRYPEFWEAVGKRATVAESEQLIAEYLAEGVEYADIIAGADRWKHYNAITGGRKATSPAKWLEHQKWRDDWTPPQHREATKPATRKAAKSSPVTRKATTRSGKPKRIQNPDFKRWHAERDSVTEKILRSKPITLREAMDKWDAENPMPERWLQVEP